MDSSPETSPSVARPFKIQKLQIGSPPLEHSFSEFQSCAKSRPSGTYHQHPQEEEQPAQNQESQPMDPNTEDLVADPFFYYQEDHVQESINH